MVAEAQFYAFSGAALLLRPESASPVSAQQGVRWNDVKFAKAVVARWHVVRGEREVSNDQWAPRLGAFWVGIRRS